MKIRIFEIKVNQGRREADPEAVQKLVGSISEVGLLNPITVDQEYTLIAGLHRLEAAKRLGWTEIECTVSGLDGLQAELAEIDENFVRKDLSDDDFRELLLRRKEIYERLHPQTKHGGDRKSEKIKSAKCALDSSPSFVVDTAEKLGVHPSTIKREIQTAKNLTPKAKGIIKDSKVSKKEALKLSRLSPNYQEEAATQLVTGNIRSIDEYYPVPAESEAAEEHTLKAPPPSPLVSETSYYPTIKDSIADLKNPDKDRRRTPETFLLSISAFLHRFSQSVQNYVGDEYQVGFPGLSRFHLDQLHEEIRSVHTVLDNVFNQIERMAQHEKA